MFGENIKVEFEEAVWNKYDQLVVYLRIYKDGVLLRTEEVIITDVPDKP